MNNIFPVKIQQKDYTCQYFWFKKFAEAGWEKKNSTAVTAVELLSYSESLSSE